MAAMLLLGALACRAEDPVPTVFPKDRYDSVRTHSPFAVASAQPAPAAPQASFASNWFVSGIARIGDNDFVTIKSRDLTTQFSLFSKETDRISGVSVASVNWSDAVGKSTVILRKGTETAKLEFNEAEVRANPSATAAPAPVANANNAANRAAARGPATAPAGQNGAQPQAGLSPEIRRRIQVIRPPQ